MIKTKIHVPCFPGFYWSIYNEYDVEGNDRKDIEMTYGELKHLDDWRLPSDYRERIAREHAERYVEEIASELGLDMELVSFSIQCPKEYNFESERLECVVEIKDFNELMEKIDAMMNRSEYRAPLGRIIFDKHSSRDGFISFMSNDIEQWMSLVWASPSYLYLSCVLWYLYCLKKGDESCLQPAEEIQNAVYDYLTCNTDTLTLYPATPEAQAEFEKLKETRHEYQLN